MKKLLHDYGIPQDTMCVFCYNTSAINLSKIPVQHSKSKHIEIVTTSYIQTIKRWTSSPSLSMVHGLNHSVRPLVLVQFLESHVWWVLHLFILLDFIFCRAHTILFCVFCLLGIIFKLCVVLVFIDLTLLVLFFSVFKNSKTKKIEKSSKILIAFFVYITCEFGLISSYLWSSAFTNLACFVCTYIFVREIMKSMGIVNRSSSLSWMIGQ